MVKKDEQIIDGKIRKYESGADSHRETHSPATPSIQADSSANDAKQPKRVSTKKLQKEIERLRRENNKLKDQLLRKMAEFDNFRKRIDREYGEIITRANEGLMLNLLPLLDDLERSLDQSIDDNGKEEFRKGIDLIYSKFFKTLQDAGLKPIESEGKEFDPEIHEAMMQVENPDVSSNHVIETFEKGYYLYDKIIRHAKVSVSK